MKLETFIFLTLTVLTISVKREPLGLDVNELSLFYSTLCFFTRKNGFITSKT